jgi:sulfhydrogenase subunit alpha
MEREITLNHITKIEGHAKLRLGIDAGEVKVCELSATEGARYFEGMVLGRQYFEAHEMTSRICGICSTGHVIAALSAVERAIGYEVDEDSLRLRELITLGERIRSHATHLYFLALPDYVGRESALAMADDYKPQLRDALEMMRVGNQVVSLIGGRDLHPVSATVGGWLKAPSDDQIRELHDLLVSILEPAKRTAELFRSLTIPEYSSIGEWFSLVRPDEYAMLSGVFASDAVRFEQDRYHDFLREYHTDYSTANFVVREEKRYMLGALARFNNNHTHLRPLAREALERSGLVLPSRNPYANNLAQAIETIHCVEHAIALCERSYAPRIMHEHPAPRAGTGIAAIEVPRGTLWHEYTIDDKGIITSANIITPTAQNLLNMQEDIRLLVPSLLGSEREVLVMEVEKLIRSYDPCFSCSAHFLDVDWVE